MDMFFILFTNLIPLYILIALGWGAGRYLEVNLHSVARINIFILLPIVTFGAIVQMKFDPAYVLLPIILAALSYTLSLTAYNVAKRVWGDGRANLLGTGTVNGNAIYFGLPVILFLFGPEWAGVYIFMNLGPSINNTTLAYFLAARGRFSLKDSFKRVFKFPAIHAAWMGLALNLSGHAPDSVLLVTYYKYAIGSMVFLGMMMIGIALSKFEKFDIDWGFVGGLFISRFIVWPLTVIVFILCDLHLTHLFNTTIYQMLAVWAAMPLMGNLVAYAAEYDIYPERAATAVLASSVFAMVSIPVAYTFVTMLF